MRPGPDGPRGSQFIIDDRPVSEIVHAGSAAIPELISRDAAKRRRFNRKCGLCDEQLTMRWENLEPVLDIISRATDKPVSPAAVRQAYAMLKQDRR